MTDCISEEGFAACMAFIDRVQFLEVSIGSQHFVDGCGGFLGHEIFTKFGGPIPSPHYSANRPTEEPHRIERLARVVGSLPKEVINNLLQIHDHKGTLFAFFDTRKLSEQDIFWIARHIIFAWESEGEYQALIANHHGVCLGDLG